ncbi:hypothetical protein CNMCM5878_008781 [Aspergillus fumigatiaffinis]|nr:hypothetical protein CNMCM5878_008781 [Aspergillus fumigatiaffinis]
MISEVAGIGLVPSIDFEIANINISINNQESVVEQKAGNPFDDDLPAVAWHYDSFPSVCVTMLSDCAGMVGGETALKTATGEIMKVRGPAMRISMVTCLRPKSPFVRDETVLTGVRGISNLSELYTQYTEYRLEILEERVRARLKMSDSGNWRSAHSTLPTSESFWWSRNYF